MTGVRTVSGGHEVTFADSKTIMTDVLVGADGAWSKVRSLLSDAPPIYSGLSFAEARIAHADTQHPALAAAVGKGSLFALSDEKGLLAHREHEGELCIYAALKVPEDWARHEITRDSLLANFADWHDDLRGLLSESDGEIVRRPLFALPVGHRWQRKAGVTLVGDAAHLMSPFAGEGVNLAMQDGHELARAIIAHPGDIEAAFAVYEAPMFIRSEASARESAGNLDMMFKPGAARALVQQMARYMELAP